ncbi:F0F1 ATP synthase subunit A [Paenibacillus alkalitolerans]|uniref:F0F1 ATP synthase subunit A n=1 Tax=Paenibacillus alkalitolerans TaxID=2799335 RepID=UPI0018F63C87|nr:F0F1 ATP synthase subunit A [Paenibacillus alkalitolerans]
MHESPIIDVGGFSIDLSAILMITVTCIIVFVLARMSVRNLSVTNPGKLQNFMEWVVDFVRNIISSTMDMKIGKQFVSLGLTLIMFIFIGNMLGLPFAVVTEHDKEFSVFGYEVKSVTEALHKQHEAGNHHPHAEVVWWKSPTADASVTMGLALITILLVHFLGLTQNTKHYLKHYFEPHFLFFPLNLLKQAAKLLTLGLRLFGNIFAGEVLIAVLIGAGVFGIPGLVIWQGFSLFVGAIQAFIFVMLTMVYLSQELDTPHH